MPTLTDYHSFNSFFLKNRRGSLERFNLLHDDFKLVFNRVLGVSRVNFSSKQKGTAVSFYLRAVKYLYTSHELALMGHIEESRIILRSVVELMIIGFLIFKEKEVYELWLECFEKRKVNTSGTGNVELKDFANRKYEITAIVSKYKTDLSSDEDAQHLIRMWGEFSSYYSHENLFNVAVRLEQGESVTEIYVGSSCESKNDRMPKSIQLTTDILKNIEALANKLL